LRTAITTIFALCGLISGQAQSKDTLRIATYNLLNYGNNTTYCTADNNGISAKDGYLKTVMQHLQPDVLVVNEVGCNTVYRTRILQNCLNIGTSKYKGATMFARSGQDICNMLFYNSDLLTLITETEIVQDGSNTMTRSAGLYQLTYNAPGLAQHADSSNFWVVATHLKAGNTSGDASTRGMEAEIIMKHLQNEPTGNFFVCGDFNVYRSSETAWTAFTAPTASAYRLNDPINKVGSWTGNSTYAAYHTQSTSTSSNGCRSGGGMDDRFDFVLASDALMNGTDKLKILPATYKALGQDGNRFNQSIDNPTNNIISTSVANALANMSDHLPVSTDFEITYTQTVVGNESYESKKLQLINPATGLRFTGLTQPVQVHIYDLQGQLLLSTLAQPHSAVAKHLPAGMYLVETTGPSSNFYRWVKP
jgi:endonuclease/exonuclease/phosphatase family metal-dependent hydrolase